MARVLIIAVAVLLGAGSVWFLVPAPVATVADTPSSLPTSKDMTATASASGSRMSPQKRLQRAEKLVGQPFKYISKDDVHTSSWFTDQGAQAIERAMDECAILASEDLYLKHVIASANSSARDSEEDLDGIEHLKSMRPTFKQLRNCINAKIAYNGLYEAKG